MAKKKDFRPSDLFEDDQDDKADSYNSWEDVSSQIFGDLEKADARASREVIRPINIFDITPDTTQPRRAMPSVVRDGWDGDPNHLIHVFDRWHQKAETEANHEIRVADYLDNEVARPETVTTDEVYTPGPIERSFLKVLQLASSILHDGLTNPITVVQKKNTDRYQLETGERRWLAYHLLHMWFGDDEQVQKRWLKIPARLMDAVSVWRQASENNARADLNAIEKARQYALLLIDLFEKDDAPGDQAKPLPFAKFEHEQGYYAQVAEAGIPYGKGSMILAAMGVNSRSALTRYRKILRLPNLIWTQADDLDMAEERLYNLAKLAEKSEAQAIKKFQQIVAGQNNSSKKVSVGEVSHAPGTKRHFSAMASAVTRAVKGDKVASEDALKSMRELRIWLDEQEKRIRQSKS